MTHLLDQRVVATDIGLGLTVQDKRLGRVDSSFTTRHVDTALLAFLCAMILLDCHGHGVMWFALVDCTVLSDDEARVLWLFGAGRIGDPRLVRFATGLVQDDLAVQLAGAARQFGNAMRSEPKPD